MREIKFRAWDKTYRKMITNFLQEGAKSFGQYRMGISFTGDIFAFTDWDMADYEEDEMHNTSCYIDRFELMQYTGLKDKNGKEIYEGDILRGHGNNDDLAQVCFGKFFVIDVDTIEKVDEVYGWFTKVIPTDALSQIEPFCLDMPLADYYIDRAEYEVIGNIYENPELMEETK